MSDETKTEYVFKAGIIVIVLAVTGGLFFGLTAAEEAAMKQRRESNRELWEQYWKVQTSDLPTPKIKADRSPIPNCPGLSDGSEYSLQMRGIQEGLRIAAVTLEETSNEMPIREAQALRVAAAGIRGSIGDICRDFGKNRK